MYAAYINKAHRINTIANVSRAHFDIKNDEVHIITYLKSDPSIEKQLIIPLDTFQMCFDNKRSLSKKVRTIPKRKYIRRK